MPQCFAFCHFWKPSCSELKPCMLHEIHLFFKNSFFLVNSGCFEIPKLSFAQVNSVIKKQVKSII